MTIGNFLQLSFSSGMSPNDIQGDSRYIVHVVEGISGKKASRNCVKMAFAIIS